MDNTKEEKSASDVLSGFFAKTQKFWIVFLILLVVVSVAIGILVTVKNNAAQKGGAYYGIHPQTWQHQRHCKQHRS